MRKRTSIKDIAKELNISAAAVSIVLSGKNKNKRVSQKMDAKIRETAKRLNYHPNNIAYSLKKGLTRTIGLIVADISNPFYGQMAYYIQQELEQNGYVVIVTNNNENEEENRRMIRTLEGRVVDGLIIVPTANCEEEIRYLLNQQKAVVFIDRNLPTLGIPTVMIDNYAAAREGTEELLARGCKRIALVGYEESYTNLDERVKGYSDVLKEQNLYDSSLIHKVSNNSLEETIIGVINNVMNQNVDAVFFITGYLSIFGVRELLRKGVKIPKELQVLSFDKNAFFEAIPESEIRIVQPLKEMCTTATKLLLKQIDHKDDILEKEQERIFVPYTLRK